MKKSLMLALGLATLMGGTAFAQDAAAPAKQDAPAAKPEAPAVENSCKNKVQITEVSGTRNGGGVTFDYFISLKNPTDKDLFVDVHFDKFPDATKIYSPLMKDVKIKPGKTQTLRFGNGITNNMSVANLTVQVDKDKPGKKPTVSLVNCREKK